MWGSSVTGSRPAPICSHLISSSSAVFEVCRGGCRVGVGPSCLDAASPCRLSMSFWSSSAWRLARASRFMPAVAIAWDDAWVGVVGSCSSVTRDTLRKPGTHSLYCADWVGYLVSFWEVGADVVSVRLSPCCPCAAPTPRRYHIQKDH